MNVGSNVFHTIAAKRKLKIIFGQIKCLALLQKCALVSFNDTPCAVKGHTALCGMDCALLTFVWIGMPEHLDISLLQNESGHKNWWNQSVTTMLTQWHFQWSQWSLNLFFWNQWNKSIIAKMLGSQNQSENSPKLRQPNLSEVGNNLQPAAVPNGPTDVIFHWVQKIFGSPNTWTCAA